ncbi:methyltransferase (plasmid) [Streptomyces sp. BI20]|uniref:methyltransferase n=1 Tax=Streptomyces sp. BI20 TaxID=3403460 RepID=UPI003C75872C
MTAHPLEDRGHEAFDEDPDPDLPDASLDDAAVDAAADPTGGDAGLDDTDPGLPPEVLPWLRGLFGPGDTADAVRRVLDAAGAAGAGTRALAATFPRAEILVADRSPARLARAAIRAARAGIGDRVGTRRADHPADHAALGPAELVWTGNACRRLGDQQWALTGLAAALRPGGILAVAERGLPPRYLPRDIGIGRPGLQARLDAVEESLIAADRARLPGSVPVVEDWPRLLAAAGLVPTGSRTFLVDLPAPLGLAARRRLHARLTRLLAEAGDLLDLVDRLTVEELVDGDACTGILWRPDAFYLTAVTVHTARLCAPRAC